MLLPENILVNENIILIFQIDENYSLTFKLIIERLNFLQEISLNKPHLHSDPSQRLRELQTINQMSETILSNEQDRKFLIQQVLSKISEIEKHVNQRDNRSNDITILLDLRSEYEWFSNARFERSMGHIQLRFQELSKKYSDIIKEIQNT